MIDRTRLADVSAPAATTAEKERLGQKLDVLDLLSEAAVEIANLDSPENIVCRRLRAMLKRLDSLESGDPVRKFTASASAIDWSNTQRSQQTG